MIRSADSKSRLRLFSVLLSVAIGSSLAGRVDGQAAEPRPADRSVETVDLFEAGADGYALYRIPGIVVTTNGTVLAYCEARRSASGDWNAIDVLMRRSVDGGKTWGPPHHIAHHGVQVPKNEAALKQNLAKQSDVTVNNPVAIADAEPGVVHFLYCVEYSRCFYQRSDDDGETFSDPVDITSAFEELRKDYDWKVIATGPGHGIQLRSGRLIVPVWLSLGTGGHAHRPSVVSTITSDDGGKTWHAGAIAAGPPELVNPSETVVAELSDGPVMLNIRSESQAHRRAVAISGDGASEWSKPVFQEELYEPICMGSLIRVPGEKGGLIFANPDPSEGAGTDAKAGQSRDRKNLTLRYSGDDGKTWMKSRVLDPGLAGYSDLAINQQGEILCFYERGSTDGNHYRTGSLRLARMPLEWLTEAE
ncbi:MAG TPA: sialidase family protein [Pirellulaceae bacterium]|jgi:sialidase-1|nr:sialidase family protein [Pirellulaceae bacterium]